MDNGLATSIDTNTKRNFGGQYRTTATQPQNSAAALSREQILAMGLAGTVSIPLTFPELGQLQIRRNAVPAGVFDCEGPKDLIVVCQKVSPQVIISRSFLADDVAAVFVPKDPCHVDLSCGTWLTGIEIGALCDMEPNSPTGILGIAYVRESAPSLLNVDAGMTAAESAEYYPPLAENRSANHYQFRKPGFGSAAMMNPQPGIPAERMTLESWTSVPGCVDGFCVH
ncbi:MAG: hypothetical protein R3C19_23540 [Planctomycetaceae bacterium]